VILPSSVPLQVSPARPAPATVVPIAVGTSLAEADRRLILATLEQCGGVKKRAAEVLGISLKTLYNRLEEYAAGGGADASLEGADSDESTDAASSV